MPRTSLVTLATVAALALLAVPSTASAATWVGHDPIRDVTGYRHTPDPKPCGTTTDIDGSDRRNADIW